MEREGGETKANKKWPAHHKVSEPYLYLRSEQFAGWAVRKAGSVPSPSCC